MAVVERITALDRAIKYPRVRRAAGVDVGFIEDNFTRK
jgi:hypothetical protein